MDTGAYMAGQMDNLIEAGLQQMEHEYEELTERIETYLKECRYTWDVKSIIEQYQKRVRGEYISHTAKDVVTKFENELHKFYNYGLYEQPQQQSTETAFAIHGVSNSVCPKCGDTGRTNPTLSDPDGEECDCN